MYYISGGGYYKESKNASRISRTAISGIIGKVFYVPMKLLVICENKKENLAELSLTSALNIWWSLLAKIDTDFRLLVNYAKMVHRRSLTEP